MRKIINGKRYDTNTAMEICDCSPEGFYHGDFRYEETFLYRTTYGNWFLAGKGGAMSRWSVNAGLNCTCGGSGIMPLDSDEARSFLEQYGSVEDVEKYFGKVLEDA
jgi:hypothetical protein